MGRLCVVGVFWVGGLVGFLAGWFGFGCCLADCLGGTFCFLVLFLG